LRIVRGRANSKVSRGCASCWIFLASCCSLWLSGNKPPRMINFQSTAMSTPHRCPPQLIPSEHARRPHVFRAGFETSQKALRGGGEGRVLRKWKRAQYVHNYAPSVWIHLLHWSVVAPIRRRLPLAAPSEWPGQTVPAIQSAADGDDGLPDRRRRQKSNGKTHKSNKMKRQRRPTGFLIGHVALAGPHGPTLHAERLNAVQFTD